MKCLRGKHCDAIDSCNILHECVYGHELCLHPEKLQKELRKIMHRHRTQYVLKTLERVKPPKVKFNKIVKSRKNKAFAKYGIITKREIYKEQPILVSVEEIRERRKFLQEMIDQPYENFHINEE